MYMRRSFVLFAMLVMAASAFAQRGSNQRNNEGNQGGKPNILVIWGDDIGTWNVSHNNRGMSGYLTPMIDRFAGECLIFREY